jgi:predicted nucleic acid-binding protein
VIYFDTSALAKKYIKETGSDEVIKIVAGEVAATSKLTYPEMISTMVRRNRAGDISGKELSELIGIFEDDYNYFALIDFSDEMLSLVKAVLKRHSLKAADGVHLASALWLKNLINENVTFVASDTNLLKAAEIEGLHTINPHG